MEQKYREAVHALMQTDKLHRTLLEKRINSLGIHRSQHIMLMVLSNFSAAVKQADLAEKLGISNAAAAVTIKKLENSGYIERLTNDGDRRANIVQITSAGKAVVEESKMIFDSVERVMTSGITRTELAGFLAATEKMQINLKEALKNEKMV